MAKGDSMRLKVGLGLHPSRIIAPSAFDISQFSADGVSFDPQPQNTSIQDLFFKPDGLTMFLAGQGSSQTVYQYTLTVPFDLSTASFASKSLSVAGQQSVLLGIWIDSTGTRLIISGANPDNVHSYTMSTPWDLATASFDSITFSLSGQADSVQDVWLSPDGLRMFVADGGAVDNIFSYTLGTALNVSTAVFDNKSISVSGLDTIARDVCISPDGSLLFYAGASTDKIFQFALSTPFDIATAVNTGLELFTGGEDISLSGVHITPSATRLFTSHAGSRDIHQFSI